MKLKSLSLLLALGSMCLASCGNGNVAGVYSFQLGRDRGVHFAARMELLSTSYMDLKEEYYLGNDFRFTLDVKTSLKSVSEEPFSFPEDFSIPEDLSDDSSQEPTSSPANFSIPEGFSSDYSEGSSFDLSQSEEEPTSSIDDPEFPSIPEEFILAILYTILGDGTAVCGYYRVGDAAPEGGKRLHLGISVNEDFRDFLADLLHVSPESLELTPRMTEMVMYSTLDDKTIEISIPVSMDDLVFQLYWYGYDLHTEDKEFHFDELKTTHIAGSHPTDADIEAINADPLFQAHHPGQKYRDYYTVTLGLTKQ